MIYKNIIEKIQTKTPFAFSRWGDGEWHAINKRKGNNVDGHTYFNDLGDALKDIVKEKQDYIMGVQNSIPFSVNESNKYEQDWVDSDVLHKKSESGELNKFIDVLTTSSVVYVGNKFHKKLEFFDEFVTIPEKNCWLERDKIIQEVRKTFSDKYKVYCFSAGMPANVLVHKLWKEDQSNAYIDVGSVFDPYVGRQTRTYHKNIKI